MLLRILLLLLVYGNGADPLSKAGQLIKTDRYKEAEAELKKVDTRVLDKASQARYNLYYGNVLASQNREEKALEYYLTAKKLYKAADSLQAAMDVNSEIAYLLSSQENYGDRAEGYLKEYLDYARANNDQLRLARGYSAMAASRISSGNY